MLEKGGQLRGENQTILERRPEKRFDPDAIPCQGQTLLFRLPEGKGKLPVQNFQSRCAPTSECCEENFRIPGTPEGETLIFQIPAEFPEIVNLSIEDKSPPLAITHRLIRPGQWIENRQSTMSQGNATVTPDPTPLPIGTSMGHGDRHRLNRLRRGVLSPAIPSTDTAHFLILVVSGEYRIEFSDRLWDLSTRIVASFGIFQSLQALNATRHLLHAGRHDTLS